MVQRRVVTAALAAAVLLVTTGCSSDDGEQPDAAGGSPPSSSSAAASPSERAADAAPPDKGSVKVVRTVAEDLDTPWGLAALPEGGLLVSSRDEATISRIDEESGKKTELGEVPGVAPAGEGGLMGIAVSPDYASDHMIYAYFTSESDNRIVRMLYDPEKPAGQQLGAPDIILRAIPKGTNHNGGRLAFGPDQMLYASTGERYEGPLAQDKNSLGGKILRMTPDGRPAPGNPFDNSVVYSYGHRNVQGLAWDSKQRLWASEFGQNTWDELNHIQPGGNYGWPDVEGKGDKSGYIDPVAVWGTDEASPSGIAIAEGSVWMAGLRGQRLWRIPLDGTKASADPQAFLEGDYGRLRTVLSAGGDKLWLVTSETDGRGSPEGGDDKILELEVK
ncbi:PQQ-dependent sugar dehydrogenase [Streptomyces sp. CA-210063]|uniref:PQQ-dependent sugar dehydrogenase n=1 Tax=Streptomyces sp. CA-210063 TaxID=2801029 RepID=UPI00214CB25C|nr:PQQ-dependent sugar dehydrogenase [Streptomyces sp. CA-210063]UUU30714.1 PQQ-dependent sugar dehydrogenase [Streptomyces sp. CA-210063]